MKPEKEQEFKEILAQIEAKDERLQKVNLNDFGLDNDDVLLLVKVLPQSQITSLSLPGNYIGSSAAALAEALPQSQVINLDLSNDQPTKWRSGGSSGAIALAKTLPNSQVVSLNLAGNDIGWDGAKALADILPQSKITNINLSDNKIGDVGVVALAKSLPQSRVIMLDLSKNYIKTAEMTALVKVLAKSQIKVLNLSENSLEDSVAIALAKVLPESQITSLDLESTKIGNKGAIALAQALSKSQLNSFNLGKNNLTEDGIVVLAKALPQSNLISFNMSKNHMGRFVIKTLAKAMPQSQITNLNLADNQIADAGAIELAKVLAQSQITNLNLADNQIADAGAIELAKALAHSHVTNLNLANNQIADAGAIELATILAQSQIINLNLADNQIADAGAIELAKALAHSHITNLDLGRNQIADAGAIELAKALVHSQVTNINLESNKIGIKGASALAQILHKKHFASFNLNKNRLEDIDIPYDYKVIKEDTHADYFPAPIFYGDELYGFFETGNEYASTSYRPRIEHTLVRDIEDAFLLARDLESNELATSEEAVALAKILAQHFKSQVLNIDFGNNSTYGTGIAALAQVLVQTQITSLDLSNNKIGDVKVAALANVLPQTQITSLNLSKNNIKCAGAAALAQVLAQSQIINLKLGWNDISDSGVAALARTLPYNQVETLDLSDVAIGVAGVVLLQAIKSSCRIIEVVASCKCEAENFSYLDDDSKPWDTKADWRNCLKSKYRSELDMHLNINKLLNAKSPTNKTTDEVIQELQNAAFLLITHPTLMGDPVLMGGVIFEKPKKLLLRAMELGSTLAIHLLGNLYLNELKDLVTAREYYLKAADFGYEISKLCLQLIDHKDISDTLALGELEIKPPRRFSLNTTQQKLALREAEISSINQANLLVSKTGISLTALNKLQKIAAPIDVYVANNDYEPAEEGHLHFHQGQTIYIRNIGGIETNFVKLVKEGLSKSFIPYNRDRKSNKRADFGFISYDMYVQRTHFEPKPRRDWTAEDVCNAIIMPLTKPTPGEQSKSYVDTLPEKSRGKPFDGYILSYTRATKFTDLLKCLNEHFKGKNPDEIFIWIDLAGINQHAWMEMKSEDIGKILEVNLTQLFRHVSEGRLIHFDKAIPTNITRSWCLVELLACLKAQEDTVAQTEICMTSDVQAQVLAQDLMQLLNGLDSSKAQCFNPQDKVSIDEQIRRTLVNAGEADINMEMAYERLNNVVKSWLISKFLPDISNIKRLKDLQAASGLYLEPKEEETKEFGLQSAVNVNRGVAVTFAYDSQTNIAAKLLFEENVAVSSDAVAVRRLSNNFSMD